MPAEGRIAIVTARWAGMRWTPWRQVRSSAPDDNVCGGRRSRVVLAPRPWRQACEVKLAGDGGNKRRFTGESTKEPVKTIARGRPDRPVEPVVTMLVCFFHS